MSAVIASGLSLAAAPGKLGGWSADEHGMPVFNYTGAIPYQQHLTNGVAVKLDQDPWFLMGNYRMTLFPHVSGRYQLISGQRSWARINQGEKKISGMNHSLLEELSDTGIVETSHSLVGLDSISADPEKTERSFGCGFARYRYDLNQLQCERRLSVMPSTDIRYGESAFVLDIKVTNNRTKRVHLRYSESVTANYNAITMHPGALDAVTFKNRVSKDTKRGIIKADFDAHSDDPHLLPDRADMAVIDAYAPALYLVSADGAHLHSIQTDLGDRLIASMDIELAPGESRTVSFVIGFDFDSAFEEIEKTANRLLTKKTPSAIDGVFGESWLNVLPSFQDETDVVLSREMIWNAYVLEAMATYSEFYDEAKIPQGTIYDYSWGLHASARDNFQHALPLCYYNPELAKSVLRYMMKRTTPTGDIMLMESGNGFCSNKYYQQSDNQINYFKLISEYLRITKDTDFLLEQVPYYPVKDMVSGNSIDFIEKYFTFLRDQIGTGNHGLILLLNADWNDAVFYIEKEPYNRVVLTGESHMNTTMALSIFEQLIPSLEALVDHPDFDSQKNQIKTLTESMKLYFQKLEKAFYKDLGDTAFTKRVYFSGKTYGAEKMFLEAQGYMLQLRSLPLDRKQRLYDEMVRRVYAGEKIGAREQEDPMEGNEAFEYGSRENGGVWYSLNGPIINGLAAFDKNEALRRLKMMGFDHAARSFPDYWSVYWSGPDNLESSLIPEEGLPDQTWTYGEVPVFCAHPHAWALYCYYKINENPQTDTSR